MRARVIVGLIGAPIGLALVWLGGVPLAATLLFISLAGALEYAALTRRKAWAPSLPVLLGGTALFVVDAFATRGSLSEVVLGAVLLGSLLAQVMRGSPANAVAGPSLELFGAVYCGWTASRFYLIRASLGDAGRGLAILTIALVWLNDMGAYFTGLLFGRRKLAPTLSPRKTIEGSLGGFVWAVAGSIVYKWIGGSTGIWTTLSWPQTIAIGLIVAACGQIGDLAESAMKRDAGVKDAGRLLPGHGGALDRFDSFFFVMPAVYYWFIWAFHGFRLM
ncbi:MAG: phosphatidate cytidylyltransferase [Clostridia bacterium]|nr:phosphatidate cytidylyltransferase [Clostridia bacterium]